MKSPEEPPDRGPDLGGPAAFRGSPVLEEVNGWIDLQVKNILFVGFRWYNLPAGWNVLCLCNMRRCLIIFFAHRNPQIAAMPAGFAFQTHGLIKRGLLILSHNWMCLWGIWVSQGFSCHSTNSVPNVPFMIYLRSTLSHVFPGNWTTALLEILAGGLKAQTASFVGKCTKDESVWNNRIYIHRHNPTVCHRFLETLW